MVVHSQFRRFCLLMFLQCVLSHESIYKVIVPNLLQLYALMYKRNEAGRIICISHQWNTKKPNSSELRNTISLVIPILRVTYIYDPPFLNDSPINIYNYSPRPNLHKFLPIFVTMKLFSFQPGRLLPFNTFNDSLAGSIKDERYR